MVVIKNFVVKGVEKVKVYEKDLEDGSDEKIQVFDLILKDEVKKGYFGKVSGVMDFNCFYEFELLFNKYSLWQKIVVFGFGLNMFKFQIGMGDLFKFGFIDGYDWMNQLDDLQSFFLQGVNDVNISNGVL